MYLQNEFILAIPFMIYVYLRIRSLFSGRILKNVSMVLFILLVAGYPAAEELAHGASGRWADSIVIVGYYCLALLLYLVMTVFAADLMVAVLRLCRIVPKERVRSPRFRRWRLGVVLAVPLLTVGLGIWNHAALRVKEYRVEIPRRNSSSEELTIVFMSDLHLRTMTSDRFLERLTRKVNAAKPDIILIGGDILEGDRHGEDITRYGRLFRGMESKFGLYAVPGNHERYAGGRTDFFKSSGIHLLSDSFERIDGVFTLAGRRDRPWRRRKISELLRDTPDDLPVILLAHRPLDFDEAVQNGVDIQLSGHTHNGQLFPVNLLTRLQYELSWGYKKKGGTHFFVTSGVQGWGPPVRTAGRSEILVIRVAFRSDTG